ncbi:unnamed protein product [Amoebophrya sp. A120]|nr:unnamed protein product [Amoebophrya sp. A120]|eukprot:GSA120T00025515001.1
MLGPALSETSWVMEKLHDKSRTLPDPDIFAFDRFPIMTVGLMLSSVTDEGQANRLQLFCGITLYGFMDLHLRSRILPGRIYRLRFELL